MFQLADDIPLKMSEAAADKKSGDRDDRLKMRRNNEEVLRKALANEAREVSELHERLWALRRSVRDDGCDTMPPGE